MSVAGAIEVLTSYFLVGGMIVRPLRPSVLFGGPCVLCRLDLMSMRPCQIDLVSQSQKIIPNTSFVANHTVVEIAVKSWPKPGPMLPLPKAWPTLIRQNNIGPTWGYSGRRGLNSAGIFKTCAHSFHSSAKISGCKSSPEFVISFSYSYEHIILLYNIH